MDVDAALQGWLSRSVGCRVARQAPPDVASRLPVVTYERTGGAFDGFTDEALFSALAWAGTDKEARALAYRLRDALASAVDGIDGCVASSATSLHRYPDVRTGTPRWQVVASISYQDKEA